MPNTKSKSNLSNLLFLSLLKNCSFDITISHCNFNRSIAVIYHLSCIM